VFHLLGDFVPQTPSLVQFYNFLKKSPGGNCYKGEGKEAKIEKGEGKEQRGEGRGKGREGRRGVQ